MSKNVKVLGQGVEKHQLVEIDILDVPSKIRKMYGIAKDKKQENFFKLLGFKLVNKKCKIFKMYERFFDTSDNNRKTQSAIKIARLIKEKQKDPKFMKEIEDFIKQHT